ncbi:MAG: hypothetical protein ABIP89_03135 [Polyangiaceae bacterium]
MVTFGAIQLARSPSSLAAIPELDPDPNAEDEARERDERDQHEVTLSRSLPTKIS